MDVPFPIARCVQRCGFAAGCCVVQEVASFAVVDC